MSKENKSDFILNNKIKPGIYIAKEHAEYFLKMSTKLHADDEFQAAIPFAILSFEESSKLNHLLNFLKKNQDISRIEWEDLQDHKFKSTYTEKNVKKELEDHTELDIHIQNLIMYSVGLKNVAQTKDDAIFLKQKEIEIQSKFPKIKEICFYANWNKKKNEWDRFQNISTIEKKALSAFILNLAGHKLLLAKLVLESLEKPYQSFPPDSLFLDAKFTKYLTEKIKHSQNLDTTKEMQKFEIKVNENVKEYQLGYKVFCKYFSN